MAFLELDNLTRRFQGQPAVDGLSLSLERGEVLALLGPSGSGKTTTLRLLAGFEVPDAGRVVLEGRDVTGLSPVARRFGMVFQHYALFPHLDVGANVAFGLESRGIRGAELSRRVGDALALVDLAGFERRPVASLSGGQQQRVALARALAPEPSVLLLDEPLSNLDPSLRERTRRELRALVHRLGITAVVVTHEQEDAFDLGDRIALLRQGHLEQLGTADELYASPGTAFVASFIGRASMLPARVVSDTAAEAEGARWPARWGGAVPPVAGAPARLLARPEGLRLTGAADATLRGTVTARRFTGAVAYFLVELSSGRALEVAAPPDAAHEGDLVGVEPVLPGLHLFPADG